MTKNRIFRLFPIVLAVLLLVVMPAVGAPPPEPAQQLTCTDLVTLATTTIGLACNELGRNQVCYGNRQVTVELLPNIAQQFTRAGDRIDLLSIRALSTSPFDDLTGDWGMAFLKAQANLPDALPGENVTFLLFGDASLDNVSADMRALRLKSGITGTTCDEAPSGVLIQSPSGQQVTMNINGADIILGSTIFMSAVPNVSMKLSTIEGVAVVTSFDDTRIVPQGGEIGIALGGEEGLEAAGAPSALRGFTQEQLPFVPLGLLEEEVALPPALPIVGAMPAITASPVGAAVPTAAATVAGVCTPRADWTARYVIQSGDTLSGIAARAGVRLDDLTTGNCITNAARILAGQTLNVPFAIPTLRPPTATFTSVPATLAVTATSSNVIIGPNLRADANPIFSGSCTVVRWDVANIREVYFEGSPAIGSDSRSVCPYTTTTYTLSVIRLDGVRQDFQITVYVEATCGNNICEPGESYSTCPRDCPR